MVKKWIKQLYLLEKSTNINFEKIILDILEWHFSEYDFKDLTGYSNLYRVRVGQYRIIFELKNQDIVILLIWTRWDVYKKLKKMF